MTLLELLEFYKGENPTIKDVIFNPPATIVLWMDSTKTVVKCAKEDVYDKYTGLLLCIAKKFFGNTGKYNNVLNQYCPEEERETISSRQLTIFEHGDVKEKLEDTVHRLSDGSLVDACYDLNHWRIPQYLSEIIALPSYIAERFSSLPKPVANHTIAPLMRMIKDEIANRYCESQLLLACGLNDKEDSEEITWEEYINEH